MKKFPRAILWLVLIVAFLAVWTILSPSKPPMTEVSYSEFLTLVKTNNTNPHKIETLTIKSGEYVFTIVDPRTNKLVTKYAHGPMEVNDELIDALQKNNVKINFTKPEGGSIFSLLIVSMLPILLIIGFFYFMAKQIRSANGGSGGGLGGGGMSFGQSKAKLLNENDIKVTLDDVAGIDEAKDEVQEIIEFLRNPLKFRRLGGRIPKGILMVGPPGTGKTLLAKAIAGEAAVPFFSISGSDFVEMFVGVGASRVRDLFEQGKKQAPCIIFIDEIDAVGRHRGAGLGGGHDEREQTLNQLLVEMDGFESSEGVIIIAATNRPDVLDPAVLRPGRFDRRVTVNRPDVRGREAILAIHTIKVPISDNVDLGIIARGTPGFVGADLENLVNEAALIAARLDKDYCEMSDFELAKDKVLMGRERRSMVIGEKEKKITAWHESGHALVAKLLEEHADPVHKVTIIPRGYALGVTQQLPKEDRLTVTKRFAQTRLAVLMGGRAAEEIEFGHYTTGASNDIQQATSLAHSMVTEYGMSKKLGPIKYSSDKQSLFLGRSLQSNQRNYSEKTAQLIDAEVKSLVLEGYETAKKLLLSNNDILIAMVETLLERETIGSAEIDAIISGEELPEPQNVRIPTYREQREAKKQKKRAKSIFKDSKPIT